MIAKWFNWNTALLFLCVYTLVKYRYRVIDSDTPVNGTALPLHRSICVKVAVVVMLCILWKLHGRHPAPAPGMPIGRLAEIGATTRSTRS